MENNNIPEQEVLDSPAADEVEGTSEIETDILLRTMESKSATLLNGTIRKERCKMNEKK